MYGPFVAVAIYTWLYVPCDHCKAAIWTILPVGPGMVPVVWGLLVTNLPRSSGLIIFLPALVASAGLVLGLAWFVGRGKLWWRIPVALVALGFNAFCAVITLSMIRA